MIGESPDEDTEPLVQRLFIGPYRETDMGSQDLASGWFCVFMNKKVLAKEYLKFIKYLGIGLGVWFSFLVILLLSGEIIAEEFWIVFMLPIGSPGDTVTAGEIFLSWLFILGPYAIYSITRSIIWAKKQSKDE